jgi:prophage regulatory protein
MSKNDRAIEQYLERLMPISEVMHLTGLSKSTIYLYVNGGEFPPAVKLGTRRVGWRELEIQSWVRARILESRNGSSNEWVKETKH